MCRTTFCVFVHLTVDSRAAPLLVLCTTLPQACVCTPLTEICFRFLWICSSKLRWLDYMAFLFLIIPGTTRSFSTAAAAFYAPSNSAQGCTFPTSPPQAVNPNTRTTLLPLPGSSTADRSPRTWKENITWPCRTFHLCLPVPYHLWLKGAVRLHTQTVCEGGSLRPVPGDAGGLLAVAAAGEVALCSQDDSGTSTARTSLKGIWAACPRVHRAQGGFQEPPDCSLCFCSLCGLFGSGSFCRWAHGMRRL